LFSAVSIHGEIDKSDLLSLESKTVYAPIGQSVNLLARATEGRAIQFCRWDAVNNSKVGNNGIIFVNEVDELPSTSIIAIQSADKNSRQIQGYDSYGDGLTNGECGITIQNVTRADITTWKYLLIEFSKVDGNPNAVTRDVQVERAGNFSFPKNLISSQGQTISSIPFLLYTHQFRQPGQSSLINNFWKM